MDTSFIDSRVNEFKRKQEFKDLSDPLLFTVTCLKNYYFDSPLNDVDSETIKSYLTDGSNDGGIDAIFNDPSSEVDDIIVVQSKYYRNTEATQEIVVGELYKIGETLKDLQNNKIEKYNEKLVTAYRRATAQREDEGVIKIVFFTSYEPANKRVRNKLEKTTAILKDYDVEYNFGRDIEQQIESCENRKLCVDSDKLIIDRKDNCLRYEDSVIVNISALSLQDLQNRRRNGLLGMNLRYFVKQKNVDAGIENTIRTSPEKFWYKNNGLLIVCEDFKIDGKEIKLKNFSIVNGGQTTNRIGHIDINPDFYLQCKIVKVDEKDSDKNDRLVAEIAQATNSQKAIKKADIKANSAEQISLHKRLERLGIYYMTKKGDNVPSSYKGWQITTLERMGKIALATVMQLPGTARNHSPRMYDDDCYFPIFKDTNEQFLADSLKIAYYYDLFSKEDQGGYDPLLVIPMVDNGKTFQLACISLLSKIKNEVVSQNAVFEAIDHPEQLKVILKNMDDMQSIIKNKIDDEKECFFEIFETIAVEVLGRCYDDVKRRSKEPVAASNYLKSDASYFQDVIRQLLYVYNQRKSRLKTLTDKIL